MRLKKFMGALVALGLVLAACSTSSPSAGPSGSSAASPQAADQVLRVDLGAEPPTLDPTHVQATDSASIQVIRSLTFPLAYFDKDLNVVPGLASSWDVAPDGTKITFHLKDGIKYSNGDPIVAADFVYSWRRLASPKEAAGYSYVLSYVRGYNEIQAIDPAKLTDADLEKLGVSAPDPQTFVVDLTQPASFFVYIATLWVTVPEKPTFTWAEAPGYVSSGPMIMTKWEHSSQIVLEPNPNWTGEPVRIARIEMSMIDDPTASLAAYQANQLDIRDVPAAEVQRVKNDSTLSAELIPGDVLSITYFGFDMKDPNGPFARSLLLRKAFSEAIDKETMIKTTFDNTGTVANSLVPPGMPGFEKDLNPYPYNLDQARKDFAAGLAELGKKASDLKLEVGYNTGADWEGRVAFLQESWRTAFGIDVKPVGLEWGAYLPRLAENPFDIFRLGFPANYPHPNNFLTDLISCISGNNYMAYCNPQVDALLSAAASKATLDEQVPLYNQAQEMVMADAPIIPLRFSQRFTLVKSWVQNLVATSQDSSTGELFYAWVTIAAH